MLREVTAAELLRDLEAKPGSRLGDRRTKVEAYKDPVAQLTKPLVQHEGRVFFYCGLLYGFCRLDASITERFREQTSSKLKTVQHVTQEPLVTLPWFPDFVKTNVSRCLQSCEAGPEQANLFDFIASQLVVDRKRQVVWKVQMQPMKIPDPVMVANREVPSAADIIIFVPYQHSSGFQVVQKSSMIIGTPEILRVERKDEEFRKKTQEVLNAKQ